MSPLFLALLPTAWATDGELEIALPEGQSGRIYVDGADSRTDAPGRIPVAPGEHTIDVKGNCLSGSASVKVSPGQVSTVRMDLKEVGGFLQVSSEPGAEIRLDGVLLSSPAMEIACGEHTLVATGEGGKAQESFVVEMGGVYLIELDLEAAALGSIGVAVKPSDASVLLDGAPVLTGSGLIEDVDAGSHTVSARYEGMQEASAKVDVKAGELSEVKLELKPVPVTSNTTPKPPREGGGGSMAAGGSLAVVGLAAAGYGGWRWNDAYQIHTGVDANRDGKVDPGQMPAWNRDQDYVMTTRWLSPALVVAGVALAGTGTVVMIDADGAFVGTTVRF